jgi:hypothetical protein
MYMLRWGMAVSVLGGIMILSGWAFGADEDILPVVLKKTPIQIAEQQREYDRWLEDFNKKHGVATALTFEAIAPTPSAPAITGAPTQANVSGTAKIAAADVTPPVIDVIQINSRAAATNDSMSATPLIQASVSDTESSLGAWSITVLNSQNIPAVSPKIGTFNAVLSGTVSANVTTLASGVYTVQVVIKDSVGNTSTKNITGLTVDTGLRITNALIGPNPYNPNNGVAKLQYDLSIDSDVNITIYSISGEKLWWTNSPAGASGGSAGFNSVDWDGRAFGQVLANGPYIAYLVAKSGSAKSVSKIKILILK